MKRFIFTYITTMVVFSTYSQGNVGPSNVIIPSTNPASGVIDGVYEKKDVLSKKRAIPYEFVRENDYVWGKRTWSYIDLREKINHPLYYPHEFLDTLTGDIITSSQGRYSLYFIIKTALQKGQIMGYYDTRLPDLSKGEFLKETGGDAFTMPASRDYSIPVSSDFQYQKDISEMVGNVTEGKTEDKQAINPANNQNSPVYHLNSVTNTTANKIYTAKNRNDASVLDPATETFDATQAAQDATGNPATVSFKINITTFRQPATIIKYLLKEDWFFDKERSILDVRTIGLAPVAQTDSSEQVLFWVYFPQLRDVLKNYYVYDPKSTVGGNTFDHLFMTRRFNAVIYKESTLYDRTIEDYRFGADALYESEKVKNTIRTFEHDVWNF